MIKSVNPFLANVPIQYPLKFSGVLRKYKTKILARNGFKKKHKRVKFDTEWY